jgi:GNAT superfamily N-acetyltransferase
MSVAIRRARETDAEFLSRSLEDMQVMHATAMPSLFKATAEPYLPEKLRDLLVNPSAHLFVAVVCGSPAGFTHLWIFTEPEGENNFANTKVFISYVYVQPESRGLGVGRALIETARTLAQELNISTLERNVMAFNADARRFFQKCGFMPLREILFQQMPRAKL